MTTKEVLRSVASEIQLFNNIEQKETFLFILGALFSKVISLQKAAEIMEVAKQVQQGKLSLEEVNTILVEQHLYTAGISDPDLLIRTSGEMRLSNFLL